MRTIKEQTTVQLAFVFHKWSTEASVVFETVQVFLSLMFAWVAFLSLSFCQASERAAILNPRIWLANHARVTGPAFYDTAHGPDFFPAVPISYLFSYLKRVHQKYK